MMRQRFIWLLCIASVLMFAGGAAGAGADQDMFLYPVAYLGNDLQFASALSIAGAAVGGPTSGKRAVIFDDCPPAPLARQLLEQELAISASRCSAVDLLNALGGAEAMAEPFVSTLLAEGQINGGQVAEARASLAARTADQAKLVADSKPGFGATIRRWKRVDPATGRVSYYLNIGPFGGSIRDMVMQVDLSLEG